MAAVADCCGANHVLCLDKYSPVCRQPMQKKKGYFVFGLEVELQTRECVSFLLIDRALQEKVCIFFLLWIGFLVFKLIQSETWLYLILAWNNEWLQITRMRGHSRHNSVWAIQHIHTFCFHIHIFSLSHMIGWESPARACPECDHKTVEEMQALQQGFKPSGFWAAFYHPPKTITSLSTSCDQQMYVA